MKKGAKAVLDASAVLALIQDERGADALQTLLPRAVVCSVNVAEVLAKLVRDGMPHAAAAVALEALHLEVVGFDAADAGRSADFVTRGVSLGDRCFLAAATRYGEGFTSDKQLAVEVPGAPRLHSFR